MAIETKTKVNVLFLTRDKLYLYAGDSVLAMDFPKSVVSDMDIKDKEGLFNLISAFIQNNKLIPAQLYFVLAESVCFTKDFPITQTTDPAAVEKLVNEFLETIPFNSVTSRVYKVPANWRVVGVNGDLVDTIFSAFANRGYGLTALLPANTMPDVAMSTDLNPQKAHLILSKKDLAVKNSMVGDKTTPEHELTTTQTAVPKAKMLPFLIAAFVMLIVVFISLLLLRK